MFENTSARLTGLYLAILMTISLFFSINIYQLSMQELDRGLRRPHTGIINIQSNFIPRNIRNQLLEEREQLYEDAQARILSRLLFVNVCILVGGGFLSYYLARRTLRPIEQAHKSLERFTADASHELRTPIAAMQSEIEVSLMDPKLTLSQAQKQLRSNLEELAKLTALSDGLLRLARMEHDGLKMSSVALESIVNRSIERARQVSEKRKIVITSPEKVTGNVRGDEESLVEALVIILDNAVKYSPEKSKVEVTFKHDHKQSIIAVKDNGIGIKASELPHIFERFYRADSARSKQASNGYGLGLAIAKNIVDLHGGTLTATSKPSKGSTFTLKLPS